MNGTLGKVGGLTLNSLPNNTFFDWTKFKAFADDKLNVTKIMISVFDREENIVGIGENAGYQRFLLFPLCCQKAFFFGSLKLWIVWLRVKALNKLSKIFHL